MNSPLAVLELRSFGVAFGERTVLAEVSFELPDKGITILVGPAGTGKSTLLRTIAGLNDAHPSMRTWGTALLRGVSLSEIAPGPPTDVRRGIGLVSQHVRFFIDTVRQNLVGALPNRSSLTLAEQRDLAIETLRRNNLAELIAELDTDVASLSTSLQRRLAVARATVTEPALLLADEPFVGLDESEVPQLLALLEFHAQSRSVLLVTHNQRIASAADGKVVLVAGGATQEIAPSQQFFSAPQSEVAKGFVRTGGCALPSPTSSPPPDLQGGRWPHGFFWVAKGKLGGMPRPGIVAELEDDLDGLRRLGITTLVTLEEKQTVDEGTLGRHGIKLLHYPIIDMEAPELESARLLCSHLTTLISSGEALVIHCRAGLGRTGTMLAACLVREGGTAAAAIDRLRCLKPGSVQSRVQAEFLFALENSYSSHE